MSFLDRIFNDYIKNRKFVKKFYKICLPSFTKNKNTKQNPKTLTTLSVILNDDWSYSLDVSCEELIVESVYKLKSFTNNEFIQYLISESYTIPPYTLRSAIERKLKDLTEIGMIRFDGEKYHFIPSEERLDYRKFKLCGDTFLRRRNTEGNILK